MDIRGFSALFMVIFVLLFTCCESRRVDADYVESSLWLWDKGFKIGDGDAVDFDDTDFYTLSNDTIYRKGVPRCVVVETDTEFNFMKVRSLDGEVGYYDNSEEFTR